MTRARTLADMISDGVIGTTELADDAITPVKLDETGSYAMAGLTVDTNTLHVDSANNRVGIGTTSPASQAHIYNAAASANLRIETDADAYASISFLNDQSNWGAGVDTANHFYVYDSINSSNVMEFGNNDIVFNQTGKDYDFRVESDSRSNALVLDGGTGGLALNTTNSDFYTGFDTTSIKLGPVASMWSLSNGSSDRRMTIDQNLYVNTDGTNRYLTTGAAARYQMNTGTHRFETAPSGSDDAAATSTVQMLIENDGEVRMLPSNTDAQNLKFRTTSTAGRSVIKSITREDSGSVNPMSQLQLMAYGTNSYLGQFKVVLNSSDTYNSTNQNNVADFKGTGGLVLNESGLSYLDFRVESDANSNFFTANAGTGRIGINHDGSGSGLLAIYQTGYGAGEIGLNVIHQDSGNSANTLANFTNNSDQDFQIRITEVGASIKAAYLGPSTNTNLILTGSSIGSYNKDLALSSSSIVVNQDSRDMDFRVESDNNANMLLVDASADQVLFGTTTTRANSSGSQAPNIVSGTSIAGQSLDGSATFNTAGYQIGNSLNTTKTIQIYPGSGVYGFLEVHVAGYNSSGSGSTHACFHAGGHTGNATLYNIQELYRFNYGNLTTSSATVTGGRLQFTVATSGTGTGGVTVISVKSMDSGAVIPRIVVT